MATFNQSPSNQPTLNIPVTSVLLGLGNSVTSVVVNTTFSGPVAISYTLSPGGPTISIANASTGIQFPTTGQIWPSGFR